MSDVPLLMALPQLLGAQHQIQYTNWQPNMPQSSMPKAPQMGHAAQMPSLPNMPAQRAPQQDQQSPFGGMGGNPLASHNNLAGYLGLDPTYTGTNTPFAEGLFGNAAGYGGLFGKSAPSLSGFATPSASSFDLSSIQLPTFNF